jgi:hypothetical protein
MKRLSIIVFFTALSLSALTFSEGHKTLVTENPLKVEMVLLNEAFKNLIESIVRNNLHGIEEAFHDVHIARNKTEEAIEKGEISLPKNNDKIKEFIEIDEKFHSNLEGLIKASKKEDMKKIQQITSRLLDLCIQCHVKFRD